MKKLKASLLAISFLVSARDTPVQAAGPVSMGYSFRSSILSAVLPIIWGEIKIIKQADGALVQWSSLDEFNADIFIVQHSTNAREWLTVGKRSAMGNSRVERYYQFRHEKPVTGNNYYRLLQLDKDGQLQYSDVLMVKWQNGSDSFIVYPNPTTNGVVRVTTKKDGLLQVFDYNGILVKTVSLHPGHNVVNLSSMPKGIYRLKLGEQITTLMYRD